MDPFRTKDGEWSDDRSMVDLWWCLCRIARIKQITSRSFLDHLSLGRIWARIYKVLGLRNLSRAPFFVVISRKSCLNGRTDILNVKYLSYLVKTVEII